MIQLSFEHPKWRYRCVTSNSTRHSQNSVCENDDKLLLELSCASKMTRYRCPTPKFAEHSQSVFIWRPRNDDSTMLWTFRMTILLSTVRSEKIIMLFFWNFQLGIKLRTSIAILKTQFGPKVTPLETSFLRNFILWEFSPWLPHQRHDHPCCSFVHWRTCSRAHFVGANAQFRLWRLLGGRRPCYVVLLHLVLLLAYTRKRNTYIHTHTTHAHTRTRTHTLSLTYTHTYTRTLSDMQFK